MPAAGETLTRFVSALHRRNQLIRLLESIGMGLCAGSGLLLLVLPILIYRGDEIGRLLIGTLVASVLAGVMVGMIRRPELLATLMAADQQFKLHDLLSTAWVHRATSEPWAQTVLALAERQVSQMRPRDLVLARLGSRAWAGIGLSVMLVMLLSLIPLTQPMQVSAGEEQAISRDRLPELRGPMVSSRGESAASVDRNRPGENRGESADASRMDVVQDASDGDARTRRSVGEGTGEGIGETGDRTSSAMKRPDTTDQPGTSSRGEARGGTGVSGTSGARGEGEGDVTDAAKRNVAPWQSSDWRSARQEAEHAVRSGDVPASYRDLVRDYFDR